MPGVNCEDIRIISFRRSEAINTGLLLAALKMTDWSSKSSKRFSAKNWIGFCVASPASAAAEIGAQIRTRCTEEVPPRF